MKEIYFDGTIHYGVVNNCCYDTRDESFSTIDELLSWANDNWVHGEITIGDLKLSNDVIIFSDGVDCSEESEEAYDMILLRKMERGS